MCLFYVVWLWLASHFPFFFLHQVLLARDGNVLGLDFPLLPLVGISIGLHQWSSVVAFPNGGIVLGGISFLGLWRCSLEEGGREGRARIASFFPFSFR